MAATGAKKGLTTQFKKDSPKGSGTYVTVAEVKSISGPSMSREAPDATHMDSPDDHGEFIAGVADGGEISLMLNFRPEHTSQGTTAGLVKSFHDGTVENWKIEWPQFSSGSPPTLAFAGLITGWEPSTATKEVITVAVKVKVSGKVTATNFA